MTQELEVKVVEKKNCPAYRNGSVYEYDVNEQRYYRDWCKVSDAPCDPAGCPMLQWVNNKQEGAAK